MIEKLKKYVERYQGSSRETIPLDRELFMYMYMMCPTVFEEVSRKFPFVTCP